LLAQMASAFQAPLQGLLQVLSASLRGLANVLDQVRKQKEGAA
jgi:ribosomal protein L10